MGHTRTMISARWSRRCITNVNNEKRKVFGIKWSGSNSSCRCLKYNDYGNGCRRHRTDGNDDVDCGSVACGTICRKSSGPNLRLPAPQYFHLGFPNLTLWWTFAHAKKSLSFHVEPLTLGTPREEEKKKWNNTWDDGDGANSMHMQMYYFFWGARLPDTTN